MVRMMAMMQAAVLLAIMVMTIAPLGHGLPDDQSPEAVEKWFKEFPHARPKLTKLHFYLSNIVSKYPPASAEVAEANITASSPTSFGLVKVIDAPLTLTPDSEPIGYAQGLFSFASQEEKSTVITLSYVFTDGTFKGSSLSVLGRNPVTPKYREFPIVGGTGDFRLVNGIATAISYYENATTGDGVLEIQAMFYRYVLLDDIYEYGAAE